MAGGTITKLNNNHDADEGSSPLYAKIRYAPKFKMLWKKAAG